jgi:hypothetical protein
MPTCKSPLSHIQIIKGPYTCHEGIWGNGGIMPLILNLSIRWTAVVTLMSLQVYKSPVPNRRFGGPLSWSEHYGE